MFTKIATLSMIASTAAAIACKAPTDHCWNGKLPSVGKDCKFICPTKPHFDTNFGGSNLFITATTYCNHNVHYSFVPASHGYGNLPSGCVPAHWTGILAGSGYSAYTADGTVIKVAYSDDGVEVNITGPDGTVTTILENQEGKLVNALSTLSDIPDDTTTSNASTRDIYTMSVFIIGVVYATQRF